MIRVDASFFGSRPGLGAYVVERMTCGQLRTWAEPVDVHGLPPGVCPIYAALAAATYHWLQREEVDRAGRLLPIRSPQAYWPLRG